MEAQNIVMVGCCTLASVCDCSVLSAINTMLFGTELCLENVLRTFGDFIDTMQSLIFILKDVLAMLY